jgi:hypothetical protein
MPATVRAEKPAPTKIGARCTHFLEKGNLALDDEVRPTNEFNERTAIADAARIEFQSLAHLQAATVQRVQ